MTLYIVKDPHTQFFVDPLCRRTFEVTKISSFSGTLVRFGYILLVDAGTNKVLSVTKNRTALEKIGDIVGVRIPDRQLIRINLYNEPNVIK